MTDFPFTAAQLPDLYRQSVGGKGQPMAPAMALALQAGFGSVERWQEEFRALAASADADTDGVLLSFVPQEGKLVHQRLALAAPSGTRGLPILALVWRAHAARMPPGASVRQQIDAFFDDIDWAQVYARYQGAVESSSDALAASHDDMQGACILDVRRAQIFAQADSMIPGATWCDPGTVGEWAATLPTTQPVIVYCIYGHEVGRSTAMRLHAAGIPARFLRGGIDGWKGAGRPLEARGGAA